MERKGIKIFEIAQEKVVDFLEKARKMGT